MMKKVLLLMLILCSFSFFAEAQTDTLRLTISQMEKQFLDSNLSLLAAHYAVDEKTALITQSRIWNLPNFSFQHGAYQTQTKKWFPGNSGGPNANLGEMSIQVQQLIQIAGKRKNQVGMAKTDADIAENQLYDLLRNLKYQLQSDFYGLHSKLESLKVYNLEIDMLGNVAAKYEKLYADGIVAMKDVVRIKSLLLSLRSEQLDLKKEITSLETELSVLLKIPDKMLLPTGNFDPDTIYTSKINIRALTDSAEVNRPDLKALKNQVTFSQYDLKYQKSLSVPDIEAIAGWDQNASYIPNYNYVGLAIDLPFWNRNKGNIVAAKTRIEQSQFQAENLDLTIRKQILKSVEDANEANNAYKNFNHVFLQQFNRLMDGANESFIKHEISLLEYIDMYETFKESIKQYNELVYKCLMAKPEINFNVGQNLIQ